MKALIDPLQQVQTGVRIAQVEPDEKIFVVADPLYWITCPDDCNADTWFYNPETDACELIPAPEPVAAVEPTKEELMAKLLEIQAQLEAMK